MTSEQQVFWCDDLRRHILSFLRKKPKIICGGCKCVCVWDKKVKEHITFPLSLEDLVKEIEESI